MKKILTEKAIESNSNYCKLPDGTLIQWGIESAKENNKVKRVVFSIPFVAQPAISTSPMWAHDDKVWMSHSANESAVEFYISDYTHNLQYIRNFSWIAIGRWT